jgi:putative phosphotransacetylase
MAADDQEALVRAATSAVLARLRGGAARTLEAPVGVSGRHVHVTIGDLATLFGPNAELSVRAPLVQPGQFSAEEAVALVGPSGSIPRVRVVGPTRSETVVELLASDLETLGLPDDVRAGERFAVVLAGPAGVVRLPHGGVVARRHLHASPADAERHGLVDGASVSAAAGAPLRRVVFDDVLVRVGENAALELHLDRDEANACGVRTGDVATIAAGNFRAFGFSGNEASRKPERALVTEADVLEAHREGKQPSISGAILTPCAWDAVRKYFPELLKSLS